MPAYKNKDSGCLLYTSKYQQPVPSEELEAKFMGLERSVSERVAKLFE